MTVGEDIEPESMSAKDAIQAYLERVAEPDVSGSGKAVPGSISLRPEDYDNLAVYARTHGLPVPKPGTNKGLTGVVRHMAANAGEHAHLVEGVAVLLAELGKEREGP